MIPKKFFFKSRNQDFMNYLQYVLVYISSNLFSMKQIYIPLHIIINQISNLINGTRINELEDSVPFL